MGPGWSQMDTALWDAPFLSLAMKMPWAFADSESFCQALYKSKREACVPSGLRADGGFNHENMFH